MELAINPSKIISSLCYSVLRLEPYTNCSFGCVYCYAKWYRGGRIKPRPKAIGMFSKVAKKLDLRLPFRLATLSDPLQDIEEEAKVSLKLMEIAYQNDIPILLSTKSDRISKNPWKGMIEEMRKNDLIVVQMSVSSLDRQDLEPKAPPPLERLKALEGIEAPKILRLQPLIPNYSFESAEEFVERVKDIVNQITVEPLRVEKSETKRYNWDRWSPYSFEGVIVKAECYELLLELRKACDKFGISFGLCKEGYFNLETANCCGMHYVDAKLRPTLREVYKAGVVDLNNLDFKDFLFGDWLFSLPSPIKKALRYHEKVFLKCLRDSACLNHLTPLLKKVDSKIVAISVDMKRGSEADYQ